MLPLEKVKNEGAARRGGEKGGRLGEGWLRSVFQGCWNPWTGTL